ncbi:DUF6049 family protein [Thermobifida cellulosilytica]|uniref:DUF6049 family protein n=1 Tax=Thermobifida cellulosilytica TaxID=144786 RepID=UPI000A83953F|nr:DUF6049 family protein [Thermobifida cellulosilytica]
MRRIAHLGAVVATALAVLPALTPLPSAPSAEAAEPPSRLAAVLPTADDTQLPALAVSEITPAAVGEKTTVTIRGLVINTTDRTLDDITVRLRYSPYPLADRKALERHSDSPDTAPYQSGPTTSPDNTPLPPGSAASFELKADAEDLDLYGGFGVYPVILEATSGQEGELGEVHTFLTYTGSEKPKKLQTAWVWPLMDRPQRADDDTYLTSDLAAELTEDGRLGRLLTIGAQDGEIDSSYTGPTPGPEETATQSPSPSPSPAPSSSPAATSAPDDTEAQPGPTPEKAPTTADPVPITWAVDPALLDDIHRLGERSYWSLSNADGSGPALEEHEATTDAQVWLAHARLWLAEDPVLAVPYANPDLPALLGADLAGDAQTAVELSRSTVASLLGREADTGLAWPADGVMDKATLEFLHSHGATTFLLDESAMPAQNWLGHTPSGAAPLSLPGGEKGTALVIDRGLSRVLGADTHTPGSSALALQRFVAETAMIAAEAPDAKRTVVLAPPQDWDPSAAYATGLLDATENLPWLSPVSLTEVRAGEADAEDRKGLTYPDKAADAQLGADHLDRLGSIRRQVQLFNSVLEEGQDPFRPAVLRLESAWWRRDDEGADTVLDRVDQAVQEHKGKIYVIPGDPITLASKNGTLGVLVANDLSDQSVTVHLSIFSENSERLSIGDYTESMEIGPGGKTTVYVPLSATVNGRTVLHLSLHNADGEPITDTPTTIPVNATGLGSGALIISGVAALVLVTALAPRAVRRWQRERARGDESAAAGPAPDGPTAADDETVGSTMPHNDRGQVGEQNGESAEDTRS